MRDNFHREFVKPVSKNGMMNDRVMIKFQALLRAMLLRRTKSSEVDGVPILRDLPPKETHLLKCNFSVDEREFYDSLEARAHVNVNRVSILHIKRFY